MFRIKERTIVLGIPLFFLAPLLWCGPAAQEDWRDGIFSTLVQVQHLFREGKYLFWYDNLGLGTPMPLGFPFDFAPPFFLAPFFSLRLVFSVFWVAYLLLGTIYCWRLCKALHIPRAVRFACTFTYVFSAPAAHYIYVDDWQAAFHGWALLPVVIFYAHRLSQREDSEPLLFDSLRLGLIGGVFIINGNSVHVALLASGVTIFTVVLLFGRFHLVKWFVLAAGVTLVLSGYRIYYNLGDILDFPSYLSRTDVLQSGFGLADYGKALLRPVTAGYFLEHGFTATASDVFDNFVLTNSAMRTPFFGAAFMLLAVIVGFGTLTFPPWRKLMGDQERPLIACSIVFIVSFVCTVLHPSMLLNIPSNTWQFRDPMIFFGILVVGIGLTGFGQVNVGRQKSFVRVVLALQVSQVFLGISPALYRNMSASERVFSTANYNNRFYNNFGREGGLSGWIRTNADQYGSQLFVSDTIRRMDHGFEADGVYGITDLALLDINPVTGQFKGVSMDALYPSSSLGYGQIEGNLNIIRNREVLDVLGIDLVLVDERDGTFAGLDYLDRYTMNYLGEERTLILFHNADAWPEAFVMDAAITQLPLAKTSSCRHDGFLCMDLSSFVHYRQPDRLQYETDHGTIELTLESGEERLVVLSTLYRPEWEVASTGGRVKIEPIAGALMGLVVPRNVTDVRITYVPRIRITLLWLSLGGGVAVLLTMMSLLWIYGHRCHAAKNEK